MQVLRALDTELQVMHVLFITLLSFTLLEKSSKSQNKKDGALHSGPAEWHGYASLLNPAQSNFPVSPGLGGSNRAHHLAGVLAG
jgi:hypothetical protein